MDKPKDAKELEREARQTELKKEERRRELANLRARKANRGNTRITQLETTTSDLSAISSRSEAPAPASYGATGTGLGISGARIPPPSKMTHTTDDYFESFGVNTTAEAPSSSASSSNTSAFNNFAKPRNTSSPMKSPAKPRDSFLRPPRLVIDATSGQGGEEEEEDAISHPGGTATATNQGGVLSASATAIGGATASASITGSSKHDPASQFVVTSRMAQIQAENNSEAQHSGSVSATSTRDSYGEETVTSNIQPVSRLQQPLPFSAFDVGARGALKQDPTSPLRSPSHASSGGNGEREFFGGGRANESAFHDGEAAVIVAQSEDSPENSPGGSWYGGSPVKRWSASSNSHDDEGATSVTPAAPAGPGPGPGAGGDATNSTGTTERSGPRSNSLIPPKAGAFEHFMNAMKADEEAKGGTSAGGAGGSGTASRPRFGYSEDTLDVPMEGAGIGTSQGMPASAPAPASASAPAPAPAVDTRALSNFATRQAQQSSFGAFPAHQTQVQASTLFSAPAPAPAPAPARAPVHSDSGATGLQETLDIVREHDKHTIDYYVQQQRSEHRIQSELHEQNERLRHELDDLEARLEAAQTESENDMSRLREMHRAELVAVRSSVHEEYIPLKAEHEEQRGQIEKLLQNLLDKDGYIEDLEDDLTDMAVKDKQLMEAKAENERLSTAIDALKEEIEQERSARTMLELEKGAQSRTHRDESEAELEAVKRALKVEQRKNEKLMANYREERDRVVSLTNQMDKLNPALQELQELRDEKAGLEASVKHFREEAVEAQQRLTDLRYAHADELESEARALKEATERAEASEQTVQQWVEWSKAQEEKSNQAAAADTEVQGLRDALARKEREVAELLSARNTTGTVTHSPSRAGTDFTPHTNASQSETAASASLDSMESHGPEPASGGSGSGSGSGKRSARSAVLSSISDMLPGLSGKSLDYSDSLPVTSNVSGVGGGGGHHHRRGSDGSTGSTGSAGSDKSHSRQRRGTASLLPTHAVEEEEDDNDDDMVSPATRTRREASQIYEESMQHIEEQEVQIEELRERVKDLTAQGKKKDEDISLLQTQLARSVSEASAAAAAAGGEMGDDSFMSGQVEQGYKDRVAELEHRLRLAEERDAENSSALPDAAINIRRQESVEAIQQLNIMRAEADHLRSELARRRQEDLTGALATHASLPEGRLQVMEFLLSSEPASCSLLEAYLRAIYAVHNPSKLESPSFIDQVMDNYAGEEQQLVDELYERYEIRHSDEGHAGATTLILGGARRMKSALSSSSSSLSERGGTGTGTGTLAVPISPSLEKAAAAASQQRVSSLFWAAVMKSVIWALLLSNGALLIINGGVEGTAWGGGGSGSCSIDPVVRLAT